MTDEEKINTDHFKTMDELLKHLKMWEEDDDYYAYCRFFCYRCAYEMAHKIEKLQKENQKLQDLKAELHAEQIKNKKLELETIPLLEGKIKQYEQQIDLEWVEENYVEKRILKRAEKIIEEMAKQLSKRPLMIFEKELVVLDDPKEIIKYFTEKVEEK